MNASMKCNMCGKTARGRVPLNGCTVPLSTAYVLCPFGHGPMVRDVRTPKNRKAKRVS